MYVCMNDDLYLGAMLYIYADLPMTKLDSSSPDTSHSALPPSSPRVAEFLPSVPELAP